MALLTTLLPPFIVNNGTPISTEPPMEEDDPKCKHTMIKDTMFYPITLIPAALIIITFCFTQKRRRLFLHVLKGTPGLLHPMDMLTKSDRISYMCALGATANLLFGCIFDNVRAIDYQGPLVMKTVILLVSVLVFGIVYFPVFGCLTAGSLLGFGIGSLYVWMLMVVEVIRIASCETEFEIYRILLAFRGLPNLFCLTYLSLRIPYKFCQDFKYREGIVSNLKDRKNKDYYTLEDLMTSNIGRHVKHLLKKPEEEPERVGCCAKVVGFLLDHIYRPHPSFRFSARFVSTLFLALLLLYAVSFQSYTLIYSFRKFIKDNILPMLQSDEDSEHKFKRLTTYVINTVIASVTIAACLGLYGIVRMFDKYRETMFAINRGKLKHLWKDRTNDYLLLAAMKYSGYQVIYVVWGFVVQVIILVIICAFIAAAIWSFRDGNYSWFTNFLESYWPIPFWAIIINVTQILMTKYTFIGHKKHLVLDNRRVLFIASYFIFFYNVFLGVFSSLLRIAKSVVIGALLLPRLDSCLLPQDFASMDPGYMTYVGFMKVENDHTHPVMLAFLRLLKILARDRRNNSGSGSDANDDGGHVGDYSRKAIKGDNSDKSERLRKRRANVFKWQTLYTLINNPDLRMDRKGYIQKIKLARELGLVIPKSDTYVTIDDEDLQGAQDLLEQRQTNVVGKIAGRAGDKLDSIKNRLQKRWKGSDDSLDDVDYKDDNDDEMDLGDGDKGDNSSGRSGRKDDEVIAIVDSKPRRQKNIEDGLLEMNGGSGNISSIFPGNKRRRKLERDVNNSNGEENPGGRELPNPGSGTASGGRDLPYPSPRQQQQQKQGARELTPVDKGGPVGGGRELPLPRNGARELPNPRNNGGARELPFPKNNGARESSPFRNDWDDHNVQHHQQRQQGVINENENDRYDVRYGGGADVHHYGRYTKKGDGNDGGYYGGNGGGGGDGGERGMGSGKDGKWGSVV